MYKRQGYGTLLKKGMCIAIEPMITLGSRQIVMERDGWTCLLYTSNELAERIEAEVANYNQMVLNHSISPLDNPAQIKSYAERLRV